MVNFLKNKAFKEISIIIFLGILYLLLVHDSLDNNMRKQESKLENEIKKEAGEKEPFKENVHFILNETGDTIEKRYNPPEGFERIPVGEDSFAFYLRNHKLKAYGEKALYYHGKEKNPQGIYDSVFDVEIGDRDLHQCADAIMLLRAEYLYQQKRYDEISFDFTNGFKADYQNWLEGHRIKINGNHVTWVKEASYDDSYSNFRKYMDLFFSYAGTLSLEKQLMSVNMEDMQIGDVFIQGGSPGHAVIVVDMAENKASGEKVFMLAQSYMPAQQTQILINPLDKDISPWYRLDSLEESLITPEWVFKRTDLKRFP